MDPDSHDNSPDELEFDDPPEDGFPFSQAYHRLEIVWQVR